MPSIVEHLIKIDSAIGKERAVLCRQGYVGDLRTVMVAGTLDQMHEHHGAALLLVRYGKVGSAFVLARSIVEGMYRGLWLNACATDAQVVQFEQTDKLPLKMPQMAAALDAKYSGDGFFEDVENRAWRALCSYTHTGMLQLGRRFTGQKVQPNYSDEEIVATTTTMTTCLVLLAGKFLEARNFTDECKEVEALIGTYNGDVVGLS